MIQSWLKICNVSLEVMDPKVRIVEYFPFYFDMVLTCGIHCFVTVMQVTERCSIDCGLIDAKLTRMKRSH